MSLSLEFETEILLNILEENCLIITSKGLSIDKVVIEFMKVYNTPQNLVLVIGTTSKDEEYIIDTFKDMNEAMIPQSIQSDFSSAARKKIYSQGGILFITARILVVDMLLDRVPFDLVNGLIIYRAHKIVDDCQEAFITRLFRLNNKKGFIVGLSSLPGSFVGDFGRLERVMRHLFIKNLYLWPRFHAVVNSSLDSRANPEVIEIRLSLTDKMKEIQFALMDLITMTLKEIARANVSFVCDIEDLTAENVITSNFDKYLNRQFEPVWHQLSQQTKRNIDDLKLFRRLLFSLIDDDCVTFYQLCKCIRENVRVADADWIFWDPAETLFVASKQRVYSCFNSNQDLNMEMNAKWVSFLEIIQEIKDETVTIEHQVHVIVIVSDDRTIFKLNDVLDKGAKTVLQSIYERFKSMAQQRPTGETPQSISEIVPIPPPPPQLEDSSHNIENVIRDFQIFEQEEKIFDRFHIHYHPLTRGPLSFERLLAKYRPKYFIFYDPDMGIIRQIEIYQASKVSPERAKIYFFLYKGSADEQKYLTSLRHEKLAFESLIESKASMIIPEHRDGKNGDNPDLSRGVVSFMCEATTSRNAGGNSSFIRGEEGDVKRPKIIVDMREFNASLPSIIHKRGTDIIPVTIEIGDYILTPEICVERKTVSDLIGSLNNGRLYNQCSAMTRHYKKSIILIEFDVQRSFSFKGRYWGVAARRGDPESYDLISKLILLTLHFTQIKIIWSPSLHFTAEIFELLKKEKDDPDVERVTSIQDQTLMPIKTHKDIYDNGCKKFLLNLPGVNVHNVYALMNKCDTIAQLFNLTKEELCEILGNAQNGNSLWDCLHSEISLVCFNDNLVVQRSTVGPRRGVFKKLKTGAVAAKLT